MLSIAPMDCGQAVYDRRSRKYGKGGRIISSSEYRHTVLVVDDEPIIADTLAEILRQSGYTTVTAYDGEDAIEAALLKPPRARHLRHHAAGYERYRTRNDNQAHFSRL